jgi:1-acyl-sn-glycerol-3-phosphate acyltransferase
MPLPPLKSPDRVSVRLGAVAKTAPAVGFLISSLLALNAAQTASLVVLPFSRRRFRAFNRWVAETWWGWCMTLARRINGARIVVTGDDVPQRENAIVVANHQQMPDIAFLLAFAGSKHRLGDLKWFVKDVLKYVPGIGWGMLFLDCVFVDRNWTTDAENITRVFARLRRDRVPLWLVSFVEGTRLSPAKLEASRTFARERGLRPPEHVQVPRTKGFAATVTGLRDHVDAVYDITLGYEEGVPTLWQYIMGDATVAYLHVRRFPMDQLPTNEAALAKWLFDLFEEKDRLLDGFYRRGCFPDAP